MIDLGYLAIMVVPLLLGVMETNSFQTTFCGVEVFGVGLIECDEFKDVITIIPGQNMDITVNATSDTITLSAPAVRTVFVQQGIMGTTYTNVTEQLIYFVSDGSIGFNVTENYP